MNYQIIASTPADENYEQAVQRAGVVELPDDGEPAPCSSWLSDLLAGRCEDNDPPEAPR